MKHATMLPPQCVLILLGPLFFWNFHHKWTTLYLKFSASRGLGSGMDSRPCSTNGDDGAPLDDQHAMSPDSNDEDRGGGLARRPGLEGANSDPEDISLPQNLLVPSTQSHATGTVRGAKLNKHILHTF